MTRTRGGEPGGARLLELARRELLDDLLPQLQGEHRYRARLIANAMKIAERELDAAADEPEAALRRFAAAALPESSAAGAMTDSEAAARLAAALRAGQLDGERALYDLLIRLTADRRASLGQRAPD